MSLLFFNKLVSSCKKYQFNKIIRTPSGGISYTTRLPAYDVRKTKACVELTVLEIGGMYRIQFRNLPEDDLRLTGKQAFKKFVSILKKFGINLNEYAIANGSEIKKDIEKYIIKLDREMYKDKTFSKANHIDFHSSFAGGLANTHPEFRDALEYIYSKRDEDDVYKLILNASIGYMQSVPCCDAKWAHLSRDAIKDNNDRIRAMRNTLIKSGRPVIAFNTDGIWYLGEPYHGKNEGDGLGQWHNDYIGCRQLRFKSAGAYEFIDAKGGYHAVVRGRTRLDESLSRDNWHWGDIYRASAAPVQYYLGEDEMIHKED